MADFAETDARYEGSYYALDSMAYPLTRAYPDDRSYDRRDRSASPRADREERNRSRSPEGRDRA
jgi:endonuclease I